MANISVIELETVGDTGDATGVRVHGADETYEQIGWAVSGIGDVNGDGFDDFAIGAYGYSDFEGATYVVFGSGTGLPANIDVDSLDGSNGFKLVPPLDNTEFDDLGFSVTGLGDVNGDGIDDFAVGAWGSNYYSGAAYVVFGKESPFAPTLEVASLDGTNGFRIDGAEQYDKLGFSVSGAGDFDGDGLNDIVVGAPYASSGDGAVYLIFGRDSVGPASINVSDLDGANGFRISGMTEGGRGGWSADFAGDINGDGFDDLILGAPYADAATAEDAGASYVVFGTGASMASSLDLSSLNGTSGFRVEGQAAGDQLGWSVSAAGDVNGDEVDDLIIGARNADPGTRTDAGRSYVLFGSKTVAAFGSVFDLATLSGANGFAIEGAAAGDNSGFSVSGAGDVNGDTYADLIIGAKNADPKDRTSGGESYVLFGAASFGAALALAGLNGSNGFVVRGAAGGDYSGAAVAGAGDVDDDGFDDLLIGAYGVDGGGGNHGGSAYLIYGWSTAVPPPPNAPPEADDEALSTSEDMPLVVSLADLLTGDTDPDENSLSITQVAAGIGGTVLLDIEASTVTFTPTADFSGLASFTYTVSDGKGGTDTGSVSVNVTAVNDAPTGSKNHKVLEEDSTYSFVYVPSQTNDFGFEDSDGNAFAGIEIAALPEIGALKLDGAGVLVGQFISADALAAGKFTYTPGAHGHGSGYASFSFRVRDDGANGGGHISKDPEADTFSWDVTPVNDAPVLGGLDANQVIYNENDLRVRLDGGSDMTVADVDSEALDGGTLRVVYNHQSGDRLLVVTTGGVSVSQGSKILVNDGSSSVEIGTMSLYQADGQKGIEVALNSAATPARLQQLLRALHFDNSSDNPATGTRTFTWTLTDGDGDTATASSTVIVSAINDRPVYTGSGVEEIAVIEDQASDNPSDHKTVQQIFGSRFSDSADGDSDSFAGIAITEDFDPGELGKWQYWSGSAWVDFPAVSTSNALTLTPETAIRFLAPANFVGASGSLYLFLIESSDVPVVNGGSVDTTGQGATSRFSGGQAVAYQSFAPVNDAPLLGGPTDATVVFTEGDGGIALLAGVTLGDVDFSDAFPGGSVTLSVGGDGALVLRHGSSFSVAGDDSGGHDLVFDDSGTPRIIGKISGIGTTAVAITALTAEATPARLKDLFDEFVYTNGSYDPEAGDRLVTLVFNDGGNGGSGPAQQAQVTQLLTIVAVNDAPTLTAPVSRQGTEDTDLVFPGAGDNALLVADPDASSLTVTLSVSSGALTLTRTSGLTFASGGGDGTADATMTFSGTSAAINAALTGLIYRGNLNYEGADTLQLTVTDEAGATDSVGIAITLVNDGAINGDSGPNSLSGGNGNDFFRLDAGGDDSASGGSGSDGFYFGGALTSADSADGGADRDYATLAGDYWTVPLTLGEGFKNIELITLLSGA
ncbi:MAG TPA: tandem-95 repeat protein, partial [Allosphingosinicella sp.]